MRFATFCVATALATLPAYAASPKVESATKAFQSVAADPAKVKTYCEMSKVMEGAGDQADAATEQKIQTLIKQLGPDFETAWNVGGELDENSPDATAYNSALDDLSSKCS
jgi:hypothetical protein